MQLSAICGVRFDDPLMVNQFLHCLTHYPFAHWCELCIAHRAQQDGHFTEHHAESAHTCFSFDFPYADRVRGEEKSCALYIHDSHSGAMHVVPTPQKGGRWLNHLCTELCRFIIWTGHDVVSLKCDQEPSALSLLESVKKTCRCLGLRVITEVVAPGSHASNGAAELTVKLVRQQANLLMDQLEKGCGFEEPLGCDHPLNSCALLHAAWLRNRFVVRQGRTPYEFCTDRTYQGRVEVTFVSPIKERHIGPRDCGLARQEQRRSHHRCPRRRAVVRDTERETSTEGMEW